MSGTFGNVSRAWGTAGSDVDYASGQYAGPRKFLTPFSSVAGGVTTLDPRIRELREMSLSTGRSGLDEYLRASGGLRDRYSGNMSAYRQAILDPLRQQVATRRGEVQRNIGMRGLAGSSFGDQALTSFDTESQRALANAAAEAETMDLAALQGIDKSRFGAQQAFAQQEAQTSQANLAEELAALGLSQQQIAMYIEAFQNQQQRKLHQAQNIGGASQNFHNLVTDWGDFTMIAGKGKGGGMGGGAG